MNRRFTFCILLAAAALPSFCRAQAAPEIKISVHDFADVGSENLAKAEAQAERIFREAGVQTTWLNCSPKLELEGIEPSSCSVVDNTHLVLKVLKAAPKQAAERLDVLGDALFLENGANYYAYAYYDRIQQLAESRQLGYELLGAVFAHEVGHLLLGSKTHSLGGIMCARWTGEELRQISEGSLFFAAMESRMMRTALEPVGRVSPQSLPAEPTEPSHALIPIQLSRRFGLILVRAEVNNRPATLVMDTGSSHTILSTRFFGAKSARLEHASAADKGSGWVGNASWVKAAVKVGDTVWSDHKFLAMDDLPDISDSVGQEVDGILGEDILHEFNLIEIDFGHNQIMLSK